jgi:diguanylate cyclase (GGDEF)-like protein
MTVDAPVNRTDPATLLQLLGEALSAAQAANRSVGLLVVHVADFQRIAAAFGQRATTMVITELAQRLRSAVKPTDVIIRIGDAKFAVLVDPVRTQGVLVLAANKVGQVLAPPVQAANAEVQPTTHIGIAVGPEHGRNADELLQHAETALLSAITDDLPYAVYTTAQATLAIGSLDLERELDAAISRGDLEVYYQPKISAADFRPCGAEALLRWTSPERGRISPDVFIPLADKPGRIEPLTAFVLNTALRQSADWPKYWGPLGVAVNVTTRTIEGGDLCGMVASALGMWDAAPSRLFIEITEGAMMRNPTLSFGVLRELRDLGVQISIDDFGTGYSSFAYFKNIPADELKIDKSFVMKMLNDDDDKKIVRTIIELAKSFGLKVTAEGVEDGETAAMLAQLRCDRLQGYHYSRPLPNLEFVAWLEEYRRAEERRLLLTPVASGS